MKTLKYKIKTKDILEVKRRRYARLIVTRALKSGRLKKPECCDLCEAERNDIEAHHVDYGAPMRIHWLCRKCHGLAHRRGHELNPDQFDQTPMPAHIGPEKVTVSTLIPIDTFLAIKEASIKNGKTVAEMIREKIIQSYPIASNQLDLFEDISHDRTQNEHEQRIRSMATNEELLPEPKISLLPHVRREGDSNMCRMEQQLFPIFERPGAHAGSLQWANAN